MLSTMAIRLLHRADVHILALSVRHVLQVAPWKSLPDTLPTAFASQFPRNVHHRPAVTTGAAGIPQASPPHTRVHVQPFRPVVHVSPTVVPAAQDATMLQTLLQLQQASVPGLNSVGMLPPSGPQDALLHLLKTMASPAAMPTAPLSPSTRPNLAAMLATMLQPQQQSPVQQIVASMLRDVPAPSPTPDDVILQQLLKVMQEQQLPQPQQPSVETLLRMLQGQP